MNKHNTSLALLSLIAASIPAFAQTQDGESANEPAPTKRTVRSAAGFESERGDAAFRPQGEFLESETRTRTRAAPVKGKGLSESGTRSRPVSNGAWSI